MELRLRLAEEEKKSKEALDASTMALNTTEAEVKSLKEALGLAQQSLDLAERAHVAEKEAMKQVHEGEQKEIETAAESIHSQLQVLQQQLEAAETLRHKEVKALEARLAESEARRLAAENKTSGSPRSPTISLSKVTQESLSPTATQTQTLLYIEGKRGITSRGERDRQIAGHTLPLPLRPYPTPQAIPYPSRILKYVEDQTSLNMSVLDPLPVPWAFTGWRVP